MFAKYLVASRIAGTYESVLSFMRLHVSFEPCVGQEALSAAFPFAIILFLLLVGTFNVRVQVFLFKICLVAAFIFTCESSLIGMCFHVGVQSGWAIEGLVAARKGASQSLIF